MAATPTAISYLALALTFLQASRLRRSISAIVLF
jgi:hypothetical protein